MWKLYATQQLRLFHPAQIIIPVAAVSPIKNGIIWWNANYLISAAMPGGMPGGSGFPSNPVEGAPV